jgi:hypothetical protein
MNEDIFDELSEQLASSGIAAALESLAGRLRSAERFHELFDVLLMRSRHELGLPVVLSTSLDDLDEPLRSQVETSYLSACREVGGLLLRERHLREAWMYLRPVGDRTAMAAALYAVEANEENVQDLIELALHEGVAPELGYALVLKHYGTCNAITTFESAMLSRSRGDQQAAAGLLLRHLHQELTANVRADIARREGRDPAEQSLSGLIAHRDELFADNNYHVDTTHLAATIRFARLIDDPQLLELAHDLAEYGRRLSSQFQFAGDEPFADVYASHGLFFAAQMGRQVDEAVDYFRKRAQDASIDEQGTGPIEVLVALLARLGRHAEAFQAMIELVPRGTRTSGFAPSLLELARGAGDYDRLLAVCRERDDLVGFAAGLVERAKIKAARS